MTCFRSIRISISSLLILLFICICILLSAPCDANSAPELIIDSYSSAIDFSRKLIVFIEKGDNPAYKENSFDDSAWKQISLPSSWKKYYPGWTGICWYRMHIKFPHELPERAVGIRLGIISDVDSIYFNGQLIGQSGQFSPNRMSAYDKKRLYEIPTQLIKPGQDNLLAMRIEGLFPFENGPHRGTFEIGPFAGLQQDIFISDFIDLIFIIFYIAVAVYSGVVLGRRLLDMEYLFFALFALCSALYFFLWTQLKFILSDNFLLLKRIEYLLLFIILPLLLAFITHFFKRKHTLIHYIYYAITLLAFTGVIISDNTRLWNYILLFIMQPSWIIPIVYCINIIIQEYKKDISAKYILISFILSLSLLCNDLLVTGGIYNFFKLSTYGFFIIIFGTAKMMRSRFLELYGSADNSHMHKDSRVSITASAKIKLDEVLAYLQSNFTEDISREGLAGAMDINPDYMGKLFKQYMGRTMSEYINELRIQKATTLLRENIMNITDIAFESGFESLATFYRVFQNITGETPTAYQEKHLLQKNLKLK
jgi:AraC-like DNA-binding protein